MAKPEACQNPIRRLAVGAEVQPEGGVHWRVWAPRRKHVTLVFGDSVEQADALLPLSASQSGYFSGFAASAKAGTRYGFRLDDESQVYPDPASRWQPDGPHELSQVVDPAAYAWRDVDWRGPSLNGQVLYEMHIGTYTPEGTWQAAARELPHLARLGVTTVELMPVAEFDGRFGWGYDGVDLFAPTRLYGTPDDMRHFVDEAHKLGLAVILDVVYNHLGPVGNYVGQFSPDYFSQRHQTDWGQAMNFDGENCEAVREFYLANAGYWIEEFHMDGLRLDAVNSIEDDSPDHIVAAVTRRVREAAGNRGTLVFAENERQQGWLMRSPAESGYGLDGGWNDDFHHSARVATTGHCEYYLSDYQGTPQELISAVQTGYLYQGQWNARQGKHRGTPCFDLGAPNFVIFLQNHDQVSNSPRGRRLHELTSPGRHRAITALWALAPSTPMLFQGQEFSASTPFFYFADHEPELAELVRHGRHTEQRHFGRIAGNDAIELLTDPCDERTFQRSKLDLSERERNVEAFALHHDLLKLRREDPVFAAQNALRIQGAVLGAEAFALRYFGEVDDRLVLVNLGRDLKMMPVALPLVAPPTDSIWRLLWSSENPRYGGLGTNALDVKNWFMPGHAAVVLTSVQKT